MMPIGETIVIAITTLSPETPFLSLGPVFDAPEAASFDALAIGRTNSYDNFGALERLAVDLTRFFTELGNEDATANAAAAAIQSFLAASLPDLGAETAWVTLRASIPSTDFDVPRWHCDGYYFAPYEGEPHKIVVTLKGPGTLFNHLPLEQRGAFEELSDIPYGTPDREKIIAGAIGRKHASQAPLREPQLYIVGARHAAIHSEPPIHEDRLFMSIVPGTAEQIAELRRNWNVKETSYT